ncbi:MAG: helix-turn-helix transcriptional regulator [Halodesulfurarchaeum sp.]
MKRAIAVSVLVGLLLIGGMISPAAAGGSFGSDAEQVGGLDSDLVIIQATVSDNGTATFQIQYAIELADENDSEAFSNLASDIETNESAYLSRFSDRMNATVDAAETATDRSMTVGDFDVSTNRTTLGKEYGLVTYSATWTGFANTSADQLLVGDALEGLFIDQDTRFEVRWSEAYQLDAVSPNPSETSEGKVAWEGPREFVDDEPSITLVPAQEQDGGVPWTLLGIGVLAVLLIAALWYRQREGSGKSAAGMTVDGPDGGGKATTEPTEPPAELLSNEERVVQYLESVGGRSKQQEIVEALDWTEAKTSQVLSDMKEAGTIEKFRIGRENVVKIAEDEEKSE